MGWIRKMKSKAFDVIYINLLIEYSLQVVDRSQNTRDFHFPPRIKAKISEYASNYAVSNYA